MKKLTALAAALVFALGFAACDWASPPEETTTQTETQTIQTEPQTQTVTLFLPNENADGFVSMEAQTDGTAAHIITLLAAQGALPEGVALLQFDGITADMNETFGEAVNALGTTGEFLLLGSLVNTLLRFFELEEIFVTVEAQVLETGHNVYDEPLRFFENWIEVID